MDSTLFPEDIQSIILFQNESVVKESIEKSGGILDSVFVIEALEKLTGKV